MPALNSKASLPLLRRALLPDEWPETYLASLARLNGVRRPWIYHLDAVSSALPGYQAACTTRSADLPGSSRPREGWPRYGTAPLPRWSCVQRSAVIRYCPMCLLERRYVRTRWRLTGMLVCTKHGCHLKTNLVDPALSVDYKRPGRLHIVDASDDQLQEAAVCCMPDELRLVRDVWGPLERAAEVSELPYEDDALGALAVWTMFTWELLVDVTRAHCREVLKTNAEGSLSNILVLLRDLQVGIAPSREGIGSFIRGFKQTVHYKAALRCIRRLMASEEKLTSAARLLPLQELHDTLVAAAPQVSGMTKAGELLFQEERRHSMSRNEVIFQLGLNDKAIDQWIKEGRFQRVDVRRVGAKRFIFLPRADVRRAKRYLNSLVYVEDFIAEHGVDWPTYFALRQSELIAPIQTGDRRYLARSEVVNLMSRLELMSSPLAGQPGMRWPLFCQETVRLASSQARYGELVRAVLSGRVAVFRNLSNPGLSAFQIGTDALAWLGSCAISHRRRQAASRQAQVELFEMCA